MSSSEVCGEGPCLGELTQAGAPKGYEVTRGTEMRRRRRGRTVSFGIVTFGYMRLGCLGNTDTEYGWTLEIHKEVVGQVGQSIHS